MEIRDICPIPLGVEICPFHENVKKLVFDEIEEHRSDNRHKQLNDRNLEHLDYYSPIHADKYTELRNWIELQAEIYAHDILKYDIGEMMITDSWLNVCHPGGYQYPHAHCNSVICALYYVSFDDEVDPPTYFYQPNPAQQYRDDMVFMLTKKNQTKYNCPNEVVGMEGTLILWPSNVVHGYKRNNTDSSDRITFSTNLMPTRVGSYKISPLSTEDRNKQVSVQRSGQLWDSPDFL